MKHELMPSLNRSLSTLGFALLLPGLGFAAVAATGGGESTTSGYQVHTFTATGSNSFSVTESGYVEVLLVGGGGGGGNTIAGGGGGGGFIVTNRFFVEGGSNYTVMVGAGGLGSPTSEGYAPASIGGRRGADSSFATFVAYGGGGGRNYQSLLPDPFVAVGSGGGMGGSASDGPFPGTYGQGHTGGTNSPIDSAGGGGGAGATGASALARGGGGGGNGRQESISGV